MKAILIEPNRVISDLLSVHLASELELEIIPRDDAIDATSFLDILPDVNFIITRETVVTGSGPEKTALEIVKHLQGNERNIFVIVIGKNFNAISENIFTITSEGPEAIASDVVDKIRTILKNKSEEILEETNDIAIEVDGLELQLNIAEKKEELSKYVGMPINLFKNIDQSPIDLFLQVIKEKRPNYIKFLKSGAEITDDILKKYADKNVRTIYIKREDKDGFTQSLNDLLINKLQKIMESGEANFDVTGDVHEVILSSMTDLGFDPSTVKLADETVKTVMNALENNDSFVDMISTLYTATQGFNYRHCYMTSLVSFNILNQFTWADKDKKSTLVFTSFFHDIALTDETHQKIHTDEELANSSFERKTKEHINQHALKASKMIVELPNVPSDAERVIKQHHGSPNGVGFTTNITNQISPLAVIFIIAEEFSYRILTAENKKINVPQLINEIEEKYSGSNAIKTTAALKQALKNSTN